MKGSLKVEKKPETCKYRLEDICKVFVVDCVCLCEWVCMSACIYVFVYPSIHPLAS